MKSIEVKLRNEAVKAYIQHWT